MGVPLTQRALTPLAKALEHDDMRPLGIERTSRIARWWNRERQLSYPVKEGDSMLRRMVCDRDWVPPAV